MSVTKGSEKSAMSTHNLRTSHTFNWDHIDVVDTEPMRDRRKVTEVIHIRLKSADINRELGYDLQPIYMPLLRGGGGHTMQLEPVLSGNEDIVSSFPAFPDETVR